MRPHPQSKKSEVAMLDALMARYPNNDKFYWNFDNDNFLCMASSDLLITDFSSIVYDWAFVFEKPLIYAGVNFNAAGYEAAWFTKESQEATGAGCGEPLWREGAIKKLGAQLDENDFPRLKEIIDNVLNNDKYKASQKALKSEAWQEEGHSATLTVDYLLNKQKALKQK